MSTLIFLPCSEAAQQFFVPTNLKGEQTRSLFDGRYTLTVQTYTTTEGAWEYTRGIVKDAVGDILFDVQRNYSDFLACPFTTNGNDYLVVGIHYQVPTLLNLTKKIAMTIENDSFCWSNMTASPSGKTLLLSGCFWGAGYEYRFYEVTGDTLKRLTLSDPSVDVDVYDEGDKDDDGLDDHLQKCEWSTDGDCDILTITELHRYYRDLKMLYTEAEGYFDEQIGAMTWENFNEKYNEKEALKAKHASEILPVKKLTLRHLNDRINVVSQWKSEELLSYEQKCKACEAYRQALDRLWKENSSHFQFLTKTLSGYSISKMWGGALSGTPGEYNLFILKEKCCMFKVNYRPFFGEDKENRAEAPSHSPELCSGEMGPLGAESSPQDAPASAGQSLCVQQEGARAEMYRIFSDPTLTEQQQVFLEKKKHLLDFSQPIVIVEENRRTHVLETIDSATSISPEALMAKLTS